MNRYLQTMPMALVLVVLQMGVTIPVWGPKRYARRISVGTPALQLLPSAVQSAAIPNGSLIEKVVCRANSEQSYALYLPTKYSPERKWPILYAFDPAARGRIPLERFKNAAELYGWIIVGSNNSRNGPSKLASEAFEAMWNDTHDRFSIDERRVYATGFSGGARAAVGLAVRCERCFAGVIASGAGFLFEGAVSQDLPFIFFATVGTDDFNFPELIELEKKLVKAGVTQRLAVFSGDHDWLPAELALEAIQWMELEAMKTGRRTKDETLIESLWQASLTGAQASEAAGWQYETYKRYQSISRDFSGLKDTAAIAEKAELLRQSRDVKKVLSDQKDEITKQRELETRLNGLLSKRRDPESGVIAAADFRTAISTLIRQGKESQDTSQRRVARRVNRSLLVGAFEQAESRLRTGDYAGAIPYFEIATEIAPDNPRVFFSLACAHARAGRKERALQALRKAVEKGFSDLETIETNPALDSLRGEAVYMTLVKGLKKEP